LAKPKNIGMPTRNTMVVPCMVNRRLKVVGGRKVLLGTASWMRISDASKPAIRKNTRADEMYITPSFL
jgi:hypothetical protein